MALTEQAKKCAKEAAQAIELVTTRGGPLQNYDSYGVHSETFADGVVAGHIGTLAFDDCMAGEPVVPSRPAKAADVVKVRIK